MWWYAVCVLFAGPSARGDLEILAYCLLQWWSGCLPWDSLVEKEDKDSVARMKIRFSLFFVKCIFQFQVMPHCLTALTSEIQIFCASNYST